MTTPYCTPQDVRNLHQNFTTDELPDSLLQPFITKAQTRIDEHLKPHYKVPLVDPVPGIISSICSDMAASFALQTYMSGINHREETPLAEIYRKRAQADLENVIDKMTLDDLPGVQRKPPDAPEMRVKVASTTPKQSPLSGRMRAFDEATRSNILTGRWPY